MDSYNDHGMFGEAEEKDFQRKTRKRIAIIAISTIVLGLIIAAALLGILLSRNSSSSIPQKQSFSTSLASTQAVCSVTQYQESCVSSLYSSQGSNKTSDPRQLFKLSLQIAIEELSNVSSIDPDALAARIKDTRIRAALNDCKLLFGDAIEQLNDSLSLARGEQFASDTGINNIETWISGSLTNQETCLDGIGSISMEFRGQMLDLMKNSTVYTSNSLAIATKILTLISKYDIPIHRKLLGGEFPSWVSAKEGRLLQEAPPKANVVVAQDGTGTFRTIAEAVASVPEKSEIRYVIYVKKGVYKERVEIDKSRWNVMMYGDGKDKTIISGSFNFRDGILTFSTATFIADGRGFFARDIGFENTAGPEGYQAVALRSRSDRSVFYHCSFSGFQDTLYTHSNRQFYRNCDISGTVDFIFGNAAVVFQDCDILLRQALDNQTNVITAQGKTDPNQNTGISIQQCQISKFKGDVTAPTYLGKPWKEYSTTVVMQTDIGGFVNPAGWTLGTGNETEPPRTIMFGEYMNTGPGSSVANRVQWAGYMADLGLEMASKYTVDSLIQGGEWLPDTGVQFGATL